MSLWRTSILELIVTIDANAFLKFFRYFNILAFCLRNCDILNLQSPCKEVHDGIINNIRLNEIYLFYLNKKMIC